MPRKLLNCVTRIKTLSLIKIDWASSWETWTWYPIAAWPVGYKLKAISVEWSRSEGMRSLCAEHDHPHLAEAQVPATW